MRGKRSCMALSAAFALSLAVMTGVAHAGAKPLPANANEYGKGYAGLTAEWLEWTVAVPAPTNPILDLDGTFAAEGQSGKVWFLTGHLGRTSDACSDNSSWDVTVLPDRELLLGQHAGIRRCRLVT